MSEQRLNRSHSLVLEFGQNKAHQTPEEKNPSELSIFIFWLARLPLPNTVKLREKTKQIKQISQITNIFITLCPSLTSYINILWAILHPISAFLSSSCHHSFPTPTYATAEEDHGSHTGPLAQPSAVT